MRFERTALYAHEHAFPVITSSLGISRWKNMQQINDSGHRAAGRYPGLLYWDYNWRKGGGSAHMIEISKRENFYQQEYCGCAYSLRDTNNHRVAMGRERIKLGVLYYGQEIGTPAAPATAEPEESHLTVATQDRFLDCNRPVEARIDATSGASRLARAHNNSGLRCFLFEVPGFPFVRHIAESLRAFSREPATTTIKRYAESA